MNSAWSCAWDPWFNVVNCHECMLLLMSLLHTPTLGCLCCYLHSHFPCIANSSFYHFIPVAHIQCYEKSALLEFHPWGSMKLLHYYYFFKIQHWYPLCTDLNLQETFGRKYYIVMKFEPYVPTVTAWKSEELLALYFLRFWLNCIYCLYLFFNVCNF